MVAATLALAFTLVLATLAFSASPALAAGESHPRSATSFEARSRTRTGSRWKNRPGTCTSPTSARDTVYKFDANGNPVELRRRSDSNALTGAATPAESFSFPSLYGSPAAIAVDNACVQHTPALTGKACEEFDPSAGDLYVMDAGHGVIDKFSPEGRYLSQIGGFTPSTGSAEGELLGLGVDGSGTVHVDLSTAGGPVDAADRRIRQRGREHCIAQPGWHRRTTSGGWTGIPGEPQAHGFAVSATGDDYPMYEPSCSCTVKFGQKLSPLGSVDGAKRAMSRWPSTPRPATSTRTISPPWPSGTRAR